MALTPSTMMKLELEAPDFSLPNTAGEVISKSDFHGKPLLVMFISNHCPFVKHVAAELAQIGREYTDQGIGVVAINSNDVEKFPDDSPGKMRQEVNDRGYEFPYLFDDSQVVATAYTAACTPDFFLFDRGHKLVYRGQLDSSRPGNGVPVSGRDLRQALDALVRGNKVPTTQIPSMGCNIKWKPGNAPDYAR